MDTQDISEDLNVTIGGETQSAASSKCWAVLAPSSSSTNVPPKEIVEDEIVIGRNSTCGVRLDDRRISSRHVKIYREPDGSGLCKVFIVDLSTNGTFLDRKRLSKNTPVKLNTGAEISLSPPDSNTRISFLFQILDNTYTQPPAPTTNTNQNNSTSQNDKRPHEEESNSKQSPAKKQRLQTDDPDDDNNNNNNNNKKEPQDKEEGAKEHKEADNKSDSTKDEKSTGDEPQAEDAGGSSGQQVVQQNKPSQSDNSIKVDESDKDEKNEEDKDTENNDKHDKDKEKKDKGDKIDNKEGEDEDDKKEEQKDEKKEDKKEEKKEEEKKGVQAKMGAGDADIEEHLVCGICQSLFHKCVSVIPCVHNFCAYCIGEWCQRSNKCPECRQKIKGISKNHIINNVVGGFLSAHPDKVRPKAELDDMDAQCKLTDQMLLKGKLKGLAGFDNAEDDEDEEDEDDEYSDENDDEEDEEDDGGACRQCRNPGADGFQCPPHGPHITCSSCNQLLPDRPASTDPAHPIPPVRCELCLRIQCDLYWGCPVFYGKNTLKALTGWQFTAIPPHTMLHNAPELQYTLDILTFNHIAGPNGMWLEILKDLDANKLQFNGTPTHVPVTSDKISCQSCARTVFESLVYKWRAALPADKVPPLVAKRPNCHWGKNCRTQQHKQDHATKFNHICEQTKF